MTTIDQARVRRALDAIPRCPRKPDDHAAVRVGPGLVRCVHCEHEGMPALPMPLEQKTGKR